MMGDTTVPAAHMMRDLWSALPPERRLVLAAGMFDSARVMVLTSLPKDLSERAVKTRLCERLYGERLAVGYRLALGDPQRAAF